MCSPFLGVFVLSFLSSSSFFLFFDGIVRPYTDNDTNGMYTENDYYRSWCRHRFFIFFVFFLLLLLLSLLLLLLFSRRILHYSSTMKNKLNLKREVRSSTQLIFVKLDVSVDVSISKEQEDEWDREWEIHTYKTNEAMKNVQVIARHI